MEFLWMREGELFVNRILRVMLVLFVAFCVVTVFLPAQAQGTDYFRIVVLGDPHLPFKGSLHTDPVKQEKVMAAKNKMLEDVNSWDDVGLVAVVGDVVGETGTKAEYDYVRDYFGKFNKPIAAVMGNHDYIYSETKNAQGYFSWGPPEMRERKIQTFKDVFQLNSVYYTREVGDYLLVFLSPDMTKDNQYMTQISTRQLDWLAATLKKNQKKPTLLFFHAPLKGTAFETDSKDVDKPQFIVQPEAKIEELIRQNTQIMAWVSGHVHLSPLKPGFHADVNLYAGRVANIHNTDMDRERIWTRSLFLYQDKVIVKTFNHVSKTWEDDKERVILRP
jgi:3',5'-cyclic-AMP phosphodiesterase